MKKFHIKLTALLVMAAMLFSLSACNARRSTKDSDDDDAVSGGASKYCDSGETDSSVPQESSDASYPDESQASQPDGLDDYIETSDDLTYPDHVATAEEIHPEHAPGDVAGDDAATLLDQVETEYLQHYVDDYADIEIYFKNPEALGLECDDVSWSDVDITADDYPEEKAFCSGELEKLYTIDYSTLDDDDRICYDKMVYDIQEAVYGYSYTAFNYYTTTFNYLVGPQSDILFILDLYQFDTVEDAENYILLLDDIDRYYDDMCTFEEKRVEYGFISSDNSYEKAAESFDSLVEQKDDCFLYDSFASRLDNIDGLSDTDRERLIDENDTAMHDVVFPEFEECATRMRALEGSGGEDAGLCRYRGGDAYYAYIVRGQSNSDETVDDSITSVDNEISGIASGMQTIINGGQDWVDEYLSHSYSKGTFQENLDYLYGEIKTDFPEIPEHKYSLMDVPEALEENFSPAAYIAYHVDDFDSNRIIVNNSNADSDIGVTLGHEGYPGHMYQSIYTRSHTSHPYMYICDSIGYAEGWATYCECYVMKYFGEGGSEDVQQLLKLEDAMNTVYGTRIDFGIHWEGWSLQDCVDYYNDNFSSFYGEMTADQLKDIYTLVLTDPCYYVKYGMGYINTCEIIKEEQEKYPDASDMEIHTAYLNALSGTYSQIQAHMDAELAGN